MIVCWGEGGCVEVCLFNRILKHFKSNELTILSLTHVKTQHEINSVKNIYIFGSELGLNRNIYIFFSASQSNFVVIWSFLVNKAEPILFNCLNENFRIHIFEEDFGRLRGIWRENDKLFKIKLYNIPIMCALKKVRII